ncbi:hypothetical protein BMS3Abin03_02174 [bacterium BMS3Abin03]|nr:hypothetical protein BMS3Abin03_02174 [bacterium BMS3Abin03]
MKYFIQSITVLDFHLSFRVGRTIVPPHGKKMDMFYLLENGFLFFKWLTFKKLIL